MIHILLAIILLNSTVPDDSIPLIDSGPLIPAEGLKLLPVTPSGGQWVDQDTWLANVLAFMGNNSTNLTTGLYYA